MMLAGAEATAAKAQPRGKSGKGGKAKLNNEYGLRHCEKLFITI